MTPKTPGHPIPPPSSGASFAEGAASQRTGDTPSRLVGRRSLFVKALAAVSALWLLAGCGGGLAFTGGSIPPGGSARLFGRVAAAENTAQVLGDVTIQVVAKYSPTDSQTLTTTTASNGEFNFIKVPTGLNTAVFTVTATPKAGSDRQAQTVIFQATNGIANDLVVSLPTSTFDAGPNAKLTLPNVPNLAKDQTKILYAHLLDASGKRLPVQPTLLYRGNSGTIDPSDAFKGTAFGSGTITAFWYNVQSVTAQIVVDPSVDASQIPPDPPDLLPGSTDPQKGGFPINQ